MPDKIKYPTEVKITTSVTDKIAEILLLTVFGLIAGSFFLAVIIINSAILANR